MQARLSNNWERCAGKSLFLRTASPSSSSWIVSRGRIDRAADDADGMSSCLLRVGSSESDRHCPRATSYIPAGRSGYVSAMSIMHLMVPSWHDPARDLMNKSGIAASTSATKAVSSISRAQRGCSPILPRMPEKLLVVQRQADPAAVPDHVRRVG